MNLRKAGVLGEVPSTTKAQYSPRKEHVGNEGRWTSKERAILPGEDPLFPGRCNYDTLSPKRRSNVIVMVQGIADEAVVIIKLAADEILVTGWRIKPRDSVTDDEVKGGTR